jgi:hypothetical protein
MKLIATKKHTREFQNAITLKVGDVVKIDLTRGSHWLGNVFCTLPDGNSGWVTKWAFENLEGSEAIVEQNYCSVELETEIGDVLEGYANTQTATWCSNAKGESGWVSDDCLDEDFMERAKRIKNLISEIEIAFASVDKGEGIGFREAIQNDATYSYSFNEASHQLIVNAQEQDTERWQDLSDLFLKEQYPNIAACVFFWSDDRGFYFMLPALMCFLLRQLLESDSIYAEWLITDVSQFARYPNFLPLLNQEQSIALAGYCEILLDIGIFSSHTSGQWHRDFIETLLESANQSLSPEWFKAPV